MQTAAAQRFPLLVVLTIAAVLRVVAAFCSRGFLASDDHHVLIVAADKLASGIPLPIGYGRSVLYPGATALVMWAARAAGVAAPAVEMLVVRLAHAALSLSTVYFAYRILEAQRGREAAMLGGLLVAAYFPMPAVSVHQLEEAVCQAPLLGACWWLLRAEQPGARAFWVAALGGVALGIATVVRVPLASFTVPFVALVLLHRGSASAKAGLAVGLVVLVVLQGWSNTLVNGEWWFTFQHRLGLAWQHPWDLVTQSGYAPSGAPWHYALTLLLVFVPPFSILLLAAACRGGRALPLLGLPTLAFFVVHSLIANKQERFLLPILPIILVLAAGEMASVREWLARRGWARVYRGLWGFFWTVNLPLLVIFTLSYSKKDRVEPLVAVQRRADATGVLVLQYTGGFNVPTYYLGRPLPPVAVLSDRQALRATLDSLSEQGVSINYAIMYSDSLALDRARLETALGRSVQPIDTVGPSLGDWLAHAINPRFNKARIAVVFAAP